MSTSKIQKMLSDEDLPSSERSVLRYRNDLRTLGFEMEYDNKTKTYTLYIEKNSLQERIIHLMVASDFMKAISGLHLKRPLQYIQFDNRTVAKGVEWLSAIFQAITEKRWIALDYQRYDAEQPKTHKVVPLFLKEYNNRWYVLVLIRDIAGRKKDAHVLFGLDRILNVALLEKVPKNLFPNVHEKKKSASQSMFDIFDNIIGVTFSEVAIEEVILSFEPKQAPYIKAQPWHHSQEILLDNEEEFRIALYVHPNEDLFSLILAQCGRVKVIEPLSLRNEVARILRKAVSFYE